MYTMMDEGGEEEEIEETVYFDQSVDDVDNFIVVSTLQDGNFVAEALFSAVEEGNIVGLEDLFSFSRIDPNYCNKHGETAVHVSAGLGHLNVLKFLKSKGADIHALDSHGDSAIYWAARQGHEHIIKYLYEEGVSVDVQNKAKETALHVACRYGHTNAVALLCRCCTDVNLPDEHGETALHIGVWHGFPKIVDTLCNFGAKTNIRNKEEETPLHCAAARGHTDCVNSLLDAGVELDLVDKSESTALHLAMRRRHEAVAFLLLRAGCQKDVFDNQGEGPIHIACRDGLLALAKDLCTSGIKVNVPNKMGFYPIHLAAKNGHIEIVRALCLAGCVVDQKNREGIPAEITALAQGHGDIADMLNRLKNDQQREEWATQLNSSQQVISRVRLKLLGHSGAGKSTLLDSLRCGYFSSWFRRSKPNHSSKSSIESDAGEELSFETHFDSYTRGIDVQQLTVSGVGDLSLWEFSGHEPYYVVYDRFLHDGRCLHAILFSLAEPFDVQVQQVTFWLAFLQARLVPQEPLGRCGKSRRAARVVLIGTHADCGDPSSVDAVLEAARLRFDHVFELHDTAYAMDAHAVGSPTMKSLKQYLSSARTQVTLELPRHTAFLESLTTHVLKWRNGASHFPVMPKQQFCDLVHAQVNPMADEEHIRVSVEQLQLMGEVVSLRLECNEELVVLNPRWLCVDIVGHLLCQERLDAARITGSCSVDEMQRLFPEADALDLLQVLESLQLCVQRDGRLEYEFPCFNMLDSQDYLWEAAPPGHVHGGLRLQCWPPDRHLLRCLVPRMQVRLRKQAQETGCRLQQWRQGSNLAWGAGVEAQLTLAEFGEAVDLKVRGPPSLRTECFTFLWSLASVLERTLSESCPGMLYEHHALSPTHLSRLAQPTPCHASGDLMEALLADGLGGIVGSERILDVVCLGTMEVPATLGPQLHASALPLPARQRLCALLDPPESMGRDWCMLAVLLGLTDMLPRLDPGPEGSPTSRILQECLSDPNSTIGRLLEKLRELGRRDATEVVLRATPFLKVPDAEVQEAGPPLCSVSHTSSSNISR